MIKKVLFILVLFCLCQVQGFNQETPEKKVKRDKWQIGIKAVPGYYQTQISYAAGVQIKRNIYRFFDIMSGMYFANYKAGYIHKYCTSIYFNNGEPIVKGQKDILSLNFVNLPILLRINLKNFYAVYGKALSFNLGYNRYYIKEYNFNMEIENVKTIAFATTLAIGYQFNLSNNYALDIEANASGINNFLKDDCLYYPGVGRLGLGITLYRNFNVNNKKEK